MQITLTIMAMVYFRNLDLRSSSGEISTDVTDCLVAKFNSYIKRLIQA
jgi:hypothetical protein